MTIIASKVLSSSYPILSEIFSYLSAYTLSKCCQVCTSWRHAVQMQMKQRKVLETGSVVFGVNGNELDTLYLDKFTSIVRESHTPPIYVFVLSEKIADLPIEVIQKRNVFWHETWSIIEKKDKIVEKPVNAKISYLLLNPKAGLDVFPFRVSISDLKKLREKSYSICDCAQIKSDEISGSLMLVFTTHASSNVIKSLAQLVKKESNCEDFVMAGGYFSDFKDKQNAINGCILTGKNFHYTYHVKDDNDVESLVQNLEAMKATIMLKTTSNVNYLVLLFSCIGRGRNVYGDKENVERDCVNKVFPGADIFGFFGNGEILIDGNSSDSEWNGRLMYSTVFCLLAFE